VVVFQSALLPRATCVAREAWRANRLTASAKRWSDGSAPVDARRFSSPKYQLSSQASDADSGESSSSRAAWRKAGMAASNCGGTSTRIVSLSSIRHTMACRCRNARKSTGDMRVAR
jgi:hypothetical protein